MILLCFIHSTIILLSALCVEVTVAGAKNSSFPSFNFPSFIPFFNLCTPLCHTIYSYHLLHLLQCYISGSKIYIILRFLVLCFFFNAKNRRHTTGKLKNGQLGVPAFPQASSSTPRNKEPHLGSCPCNYLAQNLMHASIFHPWFRLFKKNLYYNLRCFHWYLLFQFCLINKLELFFLGPL